MYKKNEGEQYIEAFPQFKKWINECICCHAKGYDPNMPDHIGHYKENMSAKFIRKYFKPLAINEDKMCEQCSAIFQKC